MIPPNKHLQIGSLAFDDLDQIDLTGPFEVLARLPEILLTVSSPKRQSSKSGGPR